MPPTPRNYQPVPYAGGPSYVPNYGTLGELMGMRARNSQVGWAQLANVFNNFVETRNQAQVAKAALAQRQAEHEQEQQLKRDEMAARAAERAEADRIRREAEKEKQQLAGEKRGDARAKAIGYGPIGEADVDTLMQSPERSGDVRYSFGPGTAQGPELQPTRDQQEMIDLRTKVEGMGGMVGPNGSIHVPPKAPAAKALQRETAIVNGRPQFVNFNPETGAYTDPQSGKPVNANPIPSQTAQGPQPTWQWVVRDGKEVYTNRVKEGDRPQNARVKATEDERKTAGFYGQMSDSIKLIDQLESQLTDRELYQITTLPQEGLIGMANRGELSEAAKRYLRAFEQFTEARLRPVSGAAINDAEYARDRRTYAKQFSETANLAADRKAARKRALDSLKKRAGVALDEDPDVAPSDTKKNPFR